MVVSGKEANVYLQRWEMTEGSGSRHFPRTRITVGQSMLTLIAVI